jgi:hypothetical protein
LFSLVLGFVNVRVVEGIQIIGEFIIGFGFIGVLIFQIVEIFLIRDFGLEFSFV